MNEKFNKNAKVEKFTTMLGIAVRLIVIDLLGYLDRDAEIRCRSFGLASSQVLQVQMKFYQSGKSRISDYNKFTISLNKTSFSQSFEVILIHFDVTVDFIYWSYSISTSCMISLNTLSFSFSPCSQGYQFVIHGLLFDKCPFI